MIGGHGPGGTPVTVSLLLFAYNHEKFVEAAVRSALAQDPPPTEIIITDDGSHDATPDLIEQVMAEYRGPTSVRFHRNPANLGLARSINNAVATATADIIVGCAGDDESLPHRCGVVAQAFARAPDLQCLSSNSEVIDAAGAVQRLWYATPTHERSLLSFIEAQEGLLGATVAFRRTLFDLFGPLDPDLQVEDRVIPLRAALAGRIGYVHEPLVRYRQHGNNIWGGTARAAVASWAEFARMLARQNRMMIAVHRNRMRDLDTGLRLFPERTEEIETVRRATRHSLRYAEAEDAMWAARGRLARLRATARAFASGLTAREARRWIKLFYLPRLYYRGIVRRHMDV